MPVNFFQERDRCASRRHLHETVEEMRKFNAKRKLKVGLPVTHAGSCMSTKTLRFWAGSGQDSQGVGVGLGPMQGPRYRPMPYMHPQKPTPASFGISECHSIGCE